MTTLAPRAPGRLAGRTHRSRRGESAVSIAVAMTVLFIMAIYCLAPVYVLFSASTKTQGQISNGSGLAPSSRLFSNIGTLFGQDDRKYNPTIALDANGSLDGTLQPGQSQLGEVAFDVPRANAPFTAEFEQVLGTKSARWTVPQP